MRPTPAAPSNGGAPLLEEIRGQERAVGVLRRAIDHDRLHHAWIFAGPPGVGRRTTALALVRALLCSAAPGRGCRECTECRLLETGGHPDHAYEDLAAAREERPNASRLSIEQVRRLSHRLSLRPVRGRRKTGIIDDADLLTNDAQEALLKTLEEPPGDATLVLVATNPDALLSTIRSRSQQLRFAPLDDTILEALLLAAGCEADGARSAARLAEGSLDRARAVIAEREDSAHEEILRALVRLDRLSIPEVLDLSRSISQTRKPAKARRGSTRAAKSGSNEEPASADAADDAGDSSGALLLSILGHFRRRLLEATDDSQRWIALEQVERLHATVRLVERNANVQLAWDDLLLTLRRG